MILPISSSGRRGSVRAKAQWEVQITAREFVEAAALGSWVSEHRSKGSARRHRHHYTVELANHPCRTRDAPALAMGNAVILKPAVKTPIAGGVIFARLLEEASLRVVNIQVGASAQRF